MKRRIIMLVIVLAAVGGGIYYAMMPGPDEIVLTGIVTTDSVIVSAQIQGRLAHLKTPVVQGQHVKKGDLLAVIQPEEWNADMTFYENSQKAAATQVAGARAELRYQELQTQNQTLQAQANLSAAKAQVKQAEAELENARLTFEREEGLFKKGVESQGGYDQARTANDAAKAHLDSLKKQVEAAQATLDMVKSTEQQIEVRRMAVEADEHQMAAMQSQLEKAKVQLNYTEIHAPIDGIIDARASLEGEVVNPGQAIVTIVDPDDLWVRIDVEETYIDSIHLGDKLKVRLPSGATRDGEVIFKGVDADFATQRDVSRTKRDIKTFEVRLRCDNKDRDLALGMTAYVTLPIAKPVDQTSH